MSSSFKFGQFLIKSRLVFYQTPLSFAFTNIRPVVPGHVLVSSVRVVSRFQDLTKEEVSDLFQCVHLIAPKIEQHFNATSLTIAIQDGPEAGQTVPHVHVHILPRRTGDFKQNDEVYEALERIDAEKRTNRTEEEMAEEADILRKLLNL
ncbi:PREDICTED: bis(5'-adenosyl)-triphosphatase-like isoform X1 [Amphimedon queenslandica]|nr:PREDICTED: bis(5'-adenosyl)-triphosphatase-like isoform X1 [Amphimedon queenslandica]|eukprot:XP_011405744.1 PREDICTED: bis(5'-adenosyl)-triphosphatase-like isoform X1 [Amphimedon queenslandica]